MAAVSSFTVTKHAANACACKTPLMRLNIFFHDKNRLLILVLGNKASFRPLLGRRLKNKMEKVTSNITTELIIASQDYMLPSTNISESSVIKYFTDCTMFCISRVSRDKNILLFTLRPDQIYCGSTFVKQTIYVHVNEERRNRWLMAFKYNTAKLISAINTNTIYWIC